MQILEAWNKDNECSSCIIDPNVSDQLQQQEDNLLTDNETDLFQISIEDYEGNQVPLRSLVNSAPLTVVTLLRHFGCMLCRQASGHLLSRREDFESLGIM